MKFLKKAVSALLAAVTAGTMLFAGSVTAGAASKTEESPYYVTYKESSEELILTVYGFSEEDYKFLTDSLVEAEWLSMTLEYNPTFELQFTDIYFEDNSSRDGYYTYKPNYLDDSHDFICGNSYTLSICVLEPSVMFSCSSKDIDSDYYWWSSTDYDRSGDTYFSTAKTNFINLGASTKIRYAYQIAFDKKLLPIPVLNYIKQSTNCLAYAGKSYFFSNEKGGAETAYMSLLGEKGEWEGKNEYAVLSFGKDSELLSGTPVSVSKDMSSQLVLETTTLTAKQSGEKIKFSWNKVDGAEKYQIYYREKGESKYKKLATVSGSKTSYSTSKLDKNKTYQFKIRSYAESNGKKVYSKFSKVKTVPAK